jgi:capsid protein
MRTRDSVPEECSRMINPISNWLERKGAEHRAEMQEIASREKAAVALGRAVEEATNQVTERPDTGGWTRSGTLDQTLLPAERASMLRQARQMSRFDPNARAVLNMMTFYIVGEGVKLTPQSSDPRMHRLLREFWSAPRNKMQLRQGEIAQRLLRDGEVFLQFFNRGEEGQATWKTTVRFRDPDLLQDPGLEYTGSSNPATDGIQLDPRDHERPLKYFFRRSYGDTRYDSVDAKDILHIKICADSEQRRGESYLQPVMEMFGQYKEWLRYRIVLNKVRTAMVMVRKVTGSSGDVEAIKASLQQSATAKAGEQKKRIPPPGTILNANAGVEYDFKSANINAGDAAEDGRSMKLGMAAGTTTPEYTFGDASNANYASTMIAESPFVKSIRYWQSVLEVHFKEIYRRVVQAAVDAGKLTPPAEDDIFEENKGTEVREAEEPADPDAKPGEPQGAKKKKEGGEGEEGPDPVHDLSDFEKFWGVDVQWPEIVHRDLKETAAAIISLRDAGLISDPTASSVMGYDYEEEVRKQQLVEEDSAENPFKQKGGAFGDEGDMDAEMQALVAGLTPEEAQKVMQSTDPAQVAALIRQKQQPKGGK